MHVTNWTTNLPSELAYRRAGGRRRYNAERQRLAAIRREKVLQHFLDMAETYFAFRNNPRGWQTRLARELGVSRAQIGRDFQTLLDEDAELQYGAEMLDFAISLDKPLRSLGIKW